MSKVKAFRCDVCNEVISADCYDFKQYIFPFSFRTKYYIKFGFEKDHVKCPKHICKNCFTLFSKFIKEVKRRCEEKDD